MNAKTLSIIIPAYNESTRIGRTLASVIRYMNTMHTSYEIIVVDDGSTDGTAELVRQWSSDMPGVRVLVNKENKGKGFSVRRGMRAGSGAYRLFMDADGSVDISHIEAFLNSASDGYDIVIGSIHTPLSDARERNGWHRRILGKVANMIVQLCAVPGVHDTQRGFKLFSARAAKVIFRMQTIERFGFDIEILVIARENGLRIKELPVTWDNPAGSKVTILSYIQTLSELARVTFNRMLGAYASRRQGDVVLGRASVRSR